MSSFDFIIEHVPGMRSLFPDLSTRRSRRHKLQRVTGGSVMAVYHSIVPSTFEGRELDMEKIQQNSSPRKEANYKVDAVCTCGGRIWIQERREQY